MTGTREERPDTRNDRTGSIDPRSSKVATMLERYDIPPDYGRELEDRWVGNVDEREGFRALATRFNRRLLRAAMESAGLNPVDGEAETLYEHITGETTDAGTRNDVRSRLERSGIDTEQLNDDFVSYQSIRTYLKRYREAELPTEEPNRVENTQNSINTLRGRTRTVTADRLEKLIDKDEITLGDHRVTVGIDVFCEDCGRQLDVDQLLNREGCDCDRD